MEYSSYKVALIQVIRTEGIRAVVWRDRSTTKVSSFVKKESPPGSGTDFIVEEDSATSWAAIGEAAFRAQEATRRLMVSASPLFVPQSPTWIEIQLDQTRCIAAPAKGAQLMVVATRRHDITKSLQRMVRNAVRRLDKVYLASVREERNRMFHGGNSI